LRSKFVAQARKYIGIPYGQRYHKPGTPDHNAPLFLDCCALVRQVMMDLQDDFGFAIGRWNQGYQYDTLPIKVTQEQLKEGDLIFVEGVYHGKKRQQKHNIVHVEISLGPSGRTIGSRIREGHIQEFASYEYTSHRYSISGYHFRSLEPWLNGECKSHCKEHPWISLCDAPDKR
ncbi:unnamed protein product, partial [Chrysoparadoxa australica]